MVKLMTLLLIIPLLVGCGDKLNIKNEVQEVKVPILYCPAPAEYARPNMPIHEMTEEQVNKDGEVAKHYKATIMLLQSYIKELEDVLEQYKKANKTYDELRREIEGKIDGE